MSDVTKADREKAHRIWNEALCNSGVPGWDRDEFFAQALADERAATLDWAIDQISKGATFGRFEDPS